MTKTMKIVLAVLAALVLAVGAAYFFLSRNQGGGTAEALATVNGEPLTYEAAARQYTRFLNEYGYLYDTEAPEVRGMFWQAAIDYCVQGLLVKQKGTEMGLLPLTAAEKAEAAAEWDAYLDELTDTYYDPETDADGQGRAAARAELLAELAAEGYSAADLEDERAYQKVVEAVCADVAVTPEEVESAYQAAAEEDKAAYEEDPQGYIETFEETALYRETFDSDVLDSLGIVPLYYQPPGYRGVIHILLEADEALLSDWQEKRARLEEQLEAAENGEAPAADAEPLTQADVDAAARAVLDSVQDKLTEIRSRLDAGESFESLIVAYGQDPEMEEEGMLAEGYSVHLDSISYDPAFVAAAFSVDHPGDISEPVLSSAGVHLVKYLRDVPEGAVPLSETGRAELTETVRAARESEAFEAVMSGWEAASRIEYSPRGKAMAEGAWTGD